MKSRCYIYIVPVLMLLALTQSLSAQVLAPVIKVENVAGLPDTCYLDSTYQVSFNVVNLTQGSVYQGPLAVLYSYNDTTQMPGILVVAETNITISPQSPINYIEDFTFYSEYFVLGGGITTVVVWPQVGSPTGEPFIKQVLLIDLNTVGLDERNNSPGDINLFPNPASDRLIVGANGLKSTLERVRIFNLSGQLVLDAKNESGTEQHLTLDVANLSSGVYILEAVTPKGAIRKKFVKL